MPSPDAPGAEPQAKGQDYGEKAKQDDFKQQTKPLVPNVYQPPEPDELPDPHEPMTGGTPLQPDESSVLFGQGEPGIGATHDNLRQWLPVLDELASAPDAHPLIGDLASRARQQLGS